MSAREDKTWTGLIGATTREVGILVGVFGLLEQFTKCPAGANITIVVVVALMAVGFIWVGMFLEHKG